MKKERGITLVALVITIIILLILAGVALSALTGNDSIIGNAKKAVDYSSQDTTVEQNMVNMLDGLLKEHLGILTPLTGIAEVDENWLAKKNTLIKPDENSDLQIVIPKGCAPAILTGSNSTTSLPGQDGSVASIMPADQWENITTEQINKGIVIVDNAITYDNGQATGTVPDFNEFVWVPIPNSDDFDRTAWTTPLGYDADGKQVGGETDENGNLIEWEGIEHYLADEATVNRFWEEQTSTEYTQMVSSVNKHKGFYIGRYEVSLNGAIAQSKRGQAVRILTSEEDIIKECKSNTTIPNMHLIYGIEWDSTLNWLNGNATIASEIVGEFGAEGTTKIMEIEDIQTNSGTWGGYADSRGNAATDFESYFLIGNNEYWKANNIYNLSGHLPEITQEKYSIESYPVARSGILVSALLPAAIRMSITTTENSPCTARASFYL